MLNPLPARLAPALALPGVVYPSAEHLRRYTELGLLGRETLPGAFRATAAAYPDRAAIVADGQVITHRELDERTDRLAAALLGLGMRPLDRVIMHLRDTPALLVAFLGSLKAGLIPLSTLAAHRESEIGQLAAQSQARMIWADGEQTKFDHIAFAEQIRRQHPSVAYIATTGAPQAGGDACLQGLIDGVDLASARRVLQDVALDPLQVAVFQLSGGTTGTPKIIPRFHSEYVYNLRASIEALGLQADDSLYMPTPMMHNLHVACGWGPGLLAGGTLIITPHVTPDAAAQVVAQYEPTRLCLPPPVLAKARQSPHWRVESLRRVRGMMAPFDARGLYQTLGVPAFHVFGMTEGVIMYSRVDDPEEARFDTIGRPISEHDELRILKPGTEEDVAPGEVGELAVRGPYTLFGYFDAPERNQQAFTSDGYYRSGDLMSMVEVAGRRNYRFSGRLKDVVDRGGEKINAEEVEQAVMRCGAFLAVAVVGAPDPVFAERVCLCGVARPGASVPDIAQLGKHLETLGLAKFKWPERLEVLEALPLTHSGKIDKPTLKRQLFHQESKS